MVPRSPFTYQVRQPNNARTSAQNPFTFQAREPNSARQPNSSRSPVIVNVQTPFTLPTPIDFANPTDTVDNPALNDPVKLTIVVLNPETDTAS